MDNRLTAKLLKAIKKRPVLYLSDHPDAKRKPSVIQAWKEIQEEVNENIEVIKNRWKNLKDTYRRCKKARNGIEMSGSNLSNWIWAEQMNFLDTSKLTQSPNRTSTSSIDIPMSPFIKQEKISDNDYSDNDLESPDGEHEQSEGILKSYELSVFQDSNDKYLSLKRKKSRPVDATNDNTKHIRSNDHSGNIQVNCDRVDLFFLGLAHSFKELSRKAQINTKFELAKVLRDAELSDLQDN